MTNPTPNPTPDPTPDPTYDPLNDSNYPNRPAHQDFFRMSEIVLQLDGQTRERDVESVVGESVDLASLSYMAIQRSVRSAAIAAPEVVKYAGLYMEGFLAGYRYHERYGPNDHSNPNEPSNGKDNK